MLFAGYWMLFCQMLLHKFLQRSVKSGHFPKTDNKLIAQKMPRPDFMILKTGTVFVCCQSSDASDLEIY